MCTASRSTSALSSSSVILESNNGIFGVFVFLVSSMFCHASGSGMPECYVETHTGAALCRVCLLQCKEPKSA